MLRQILTFEQFQKLGKVNMRAYPFSGLLKPSIKYQPFTLLDGEDAMGASLVIGQMKTGTQKGKWTAYVLSFDADITWGSNRTWASEEAAMSDLSWVKGNVKWDDLRDHPIRFRDP